MPLFCSTPVSLFIVSLIQMAYFLLDNLKLLRRTLVLSACIFLAVLSTACEDAEEEGPPPGFEPVERPMMLFTDTTLLDFYEKEKLSWKVKTAYLERWGGTEKIFAKPILVDIFDSVGERSAFLRADSGTLDSKMNYVYAYGHVYALTPKGASVRADSLLWNKKDNLVKTESYVRVVSEDGDVLQGKGFVSDAKMDNWHILSDVTGIFQDAAKRLKEEDKKQSKDIVEDVPAPHRPPVQKPSPKPGPKSAPKQTAPKKTASGGRK